MTKYAATKFRSGTTTTLGSGSFIFSNNQTSSADILGFTGTSTSSKYLVGIVRQRSGTTLYETLDVLIVYKSSSYELVITGGGDDSGVSLTITSSGQVQYTSTNDATHVIGNIYWKQQVSL